MKDLTRVAIPGTERVSWPGAAPAHPLDPDELLTLTAWLRPRASEVLDADVLDAVRKPPGERAYERGAILRERTDADPADVETFSRHCAALGIEVLERHWRSVTIRGTAGMLTDAFGATVSMYRDGNGRTFRHRSESLSAPSGITPLLHGVFGLHQWPRSRRIGSLTRHCNPLTTQQITDRYAFPEGDGEGQTVGVLQFGGEFRPGDFDACMHSQQCAAARPVVKRVDDAALKHEYDTTKDLEAALDSQVIAALVPQARVVIYQAPDDERGFLDALRTAIFDCEYAPSILSISYGWPEFLWTPAALGIMHALFRVAVLSGISIFCASGDNGAELDYDGKPHVLAPASDPLVHACGATSIVTDATGDREIAWDRTGGGFSERIAAPAWQQTPMRGVPDVVAQAMPGYCVYLDGIELAMGGTSAIAPMMAALAARLNQRLCRRIGLVTPLLYARPQAMREIVDGANDLYGASAGWNPCTGLGAPIGSAIESALR